MEETQLTSNIITIDTKIFMMKLLNKKNYLQFFKHVEISEKHPLPETKVPYAWLAHAMCQGASDQHRTTQIKEILALSAKIEIPSMDCMWSTPEQACLKHTCLQILCEKNASRDTEHTEERDVCYTTKVIDLLEKQKERKNPDLISKAELYQLIKKVYPLYCPDTLPLASIVAAHRNWYLLVIIIACANSGIYAKKVSANGVVQVIRDLRSKTSVRKSKGKIKELKKKVIVHKEAAQDFDCVKVPKKASLTSVTKDDLQAIFAQLAAKFDC
jgi:hypothetical protein